MKRSFLKRGTTQLKRSNIRRVSKKRAKEMVEYNKLRLVYMGEHLVCEKCNQAPSQDLHHKHKRGIYYLTVEYFSALCRPCHTHIHDYPNQAREEGWLIN